MTRSYKSFDCLSGLQLFAFFLLAFLLLSSGIIASSDGVTVFNVTQALLERGELSIFSGNAAPGLDGKLYSRYGIALSIGAMPLYLLGKLLANFVPQTMASLAIKGVVSLTNAFIGAMVCLLFYKTGCRLGQQPRIAWYLTLAFAFSTFFVVYATKSFLTQPLETLCLAGAIYWLIAFRQTLKPGYLLYAGLFSGLGILTKWIFIINLPILTGYALNVSLQGQRRKTLVAFTVPVTLSLALALLYNHARFGSILETGYAGEMGFTTPLLVGLYGLLFSSGKSLFLYAPVAYMGLRSLAGFLKEHRTEGWLFITLIAVNLLVIAKYRHWAGEGSWGPRYLTLILPCLLWPIGASLQTGKPYLRPIFLALVMVGLLVQWGGVSVYYGTYYRAIGEFPYRTEFTDPLFLFKAHYVPNYSPAWGQLRMSLGNWTRFLGQQRPDLTLQPGDERIPLKESDLKKLTETLDLWFAYAFYGGVPFIITVISEGSLLALTLLIGRQIHRSISRGLG